MKKYQNERTGAVNELQARFKLAPIAVGCALFAFNLTAAQAQQAADGNLGSVTITGIRKGIEDAISVKKGSDSIVESVSAEDIGKLPDVSIAESIARLPGLAAQRVAGRAQVISVRGLAPDFTATTLNGRELVSTGDNRSVEYDQYPSELMSGATVFKTPDASLVGQGLAATIDMQTVRPLSFPGRTISVNVRGERNSLGSISNAKDTGNRESFTYINQFADRKVGVAFGYARMASPILDVESDLYEWKPQSAARPVGIPATAGWTDGVKAVSRAGTNLREGLMGVLEVRAAKDWTSTVDMFFSKFSQENTGYQMEIPLKSGSSKTPDPVYTAATVNANNVLSGGSVSGAYPIIRGMYNKSDDDIKALGWNNKFKLAGIPFVADMSYSKAIRDEANLEANLSMRNVAGGRVPDNLNINYATGGAPYFTTGLNYGELSKLGIGDTEYGDGYGKLPHIEDELKGMKLAATLPVPTMLESVFSDTNVGVNYSTRNKSYSQPQDSFVLKASGGGVQRMSPDLLYAPVNLEFSGSGVIPSWNVPAYLQQYMNFNPTTDSDTWKAGKVYQINEKILTSYIKGNLDTSIMGLPVRGNVGLQVQSADQSSTSRAVINGKMQPFTDGKTYTDVLPSMNLAFSLANDQTLRLGASQQLARPRVDQLRAARNFSVDATTGKPQGDGGNPLLDPWRANAYDVSFEKYFANNAGYFSAAAFFKDLKSYVYQSTEANHDFSKELAAYKVDPPNSPVFSSNFGNYTSSFNGQGGSVKGIELAVSIPFRLVSSTLDGFGVIAGTSFNDSAIMVKDESGKIEGDMPLPGLSKHVSNLTVYYEKNGFSTRLSQRMRSDFVGEIKTYDGTRALKYVVGENITDFQMGYNFDSGQYKGLGLLLQVNNLTDTAYKTYSGTPDKPLDYIKYGRSVMFGATYKF
jgi:TonB-dependent receptor